MRDLTSRARCGRRVHPPVRQRLLELVLVEHDGPSLVQPEIEEEIGRVPDVVGAKLDRCERVHVEPGEGAVGQVESADVVPQIGKAEPHDRGAVLGHHPAVHLHGVLEPGGLFYLGLYGGREFEGVWEGDYFEPKRFFCHHPDEDLRARVGEVFDLESFQRIAHGWNGLHFQSLILRRPFAADHDA